MKEKILILLFALALFSSCSNEPKPVEETTADFRYEITLTPSAPLKVSIIASSLKGKIMKDGELVGASHPSDPNVYLYHSDDAEIGYTYNTTFEAKSIFFDLILDIDGIDSHLPSTATLNVRAYKNKELLKSFQYDLKFDDSTMPFVQHYGMYLNSNTVEN